MEMTPIFKLDDAVAEYLEYCYPGQTMGGWALGFQLTSITSDPDLIPFSTMSSFVFGPQTSSETALGLYSLSAKRLSKHVL